MSFSDCDISNDGLEVELPDSMIHSLRSVLDQVDQLLESEWVSLSSIEDEGEGVADLRALSPEHCREVVIMSKDHYVLQQSAKVLPEFKVELVEDLVVDLLARLVDSQSSILYIPKI